jgi:hypothetical protein
LRETLPSWVVIGRSVTGIPSNVELIRSKEGAAAAPQQACLTKESDPAIGSAHSLFAGPVLADIPQFPPGRTKM